MPTIAKKPVIRRIGQMNVKIDADGVHIRGFRRRRWLTVTWREVAKKAIQNSLPEEKRNWTEEQWDNCLKMIGAK